MKLADAQVPVRLKLSALWASVMFLYVYGDFFGLFKPGKLAAMLAGQTPIGPTTQGMLLGFAVLMAIPSVMVFLSLTLPPNFARWTNVVFGVLYSLVMAISMRGAWGFYLFLGCVEIALTVAIAWYALRWPRSTTWNSASPPDPVE